MQRQIQKLSIFKTSDLLNKLVIYQNLYSVSRVTAVATGKHTYFYKHNLNRTYNNKRHRIKFIPTLLQPASMTECISTATTPQSQSPSCYKIPHFLTHTPCGREFFLVSCSIQSLFLHCEILPSKICSSLWGSDYVQTLLFTCAFAASSHLHDTAASTPREASLLQIVLLNCN